MLPLASELHTVPGIPMGITGSERRGWIAGEAGADDVLESLPAAQRKVAKQKLGVAQSADTKNAVARIKAAA